VFLGPRTVSSSSVLPSSGEGWLLGQLLIKPSYVTASRAAYTNGDVAGLSVAGLSFGEILNGHLPKCPFRISQWTLK